jgi:hypothetical protein
MAGLLYYTGSTARSSACHSALELAPHFRKRTLLGWALEQRGPLRTRRSPSYQEVREPRSPASGHARIARPTPTSRKPADRARPGAFSTSIETLARETATSRRTRRPLIHIRRLGDPGTRRLTRLEQALEERSAVGDAFLRVRAAPSTRSDRTRAYATLRETDRPREDDDGPNTIRARHLYLSRGGSPGQAPAATNAELTGAGQERPRTGIRQERWPVRDPQGLFAAPPSPDETIFFSTGLSCAARPHVAEG